MPTRKPLVQYCDCCTMKASDLKFYVYQMCIGQGLSLVQLDQILLCLMQPSYHLGSRLVACTTQFPLRMLRDALVPSVSFQRNCLECGKLLCSNSIVLVRKSDQFSSQSLLSNNGMYANKKPSCTIIFNCLSTLTETVAV